MTTKNPVLGTLFWAGDQAACPLHSYSAIIEPLAHDHERPEDATVNLELKFSGDLLGRVFASIRKHMQTTPHNPVAIYGEYGRSSYSFGAQVQSWEDPGKEFGAVMTLRLRTTRENFRGPVAVDTPPVYQPEPEAPRQKVEQKPSGSFAASVVLAAPAPLSDFHAAPPDSDGNVRVEVMLGRSAQRDRFVQHMQRFPNATPEVVGSWDGKSYRLRKSTVLSIDGNSGRVVLSCADSAFDSPAIRAAWSSQVELV
jgi:hypothetical protein